MSGSKKTPKDQKKVNDGMWLDARCNPLLKTKEDLSNYHELRSLVAGWPKNFTRQLDSQKSKHHHLCIWLRTLAPKLVESEKKLGFKYSWTTFANRIATGRTDFPTCKNEACGKKFGMGKNVKVNEGYNERCSWDCMHSDKSLVMKAKATRKRKYGSENYVNVDAMRATVAKHIEEDPEYYKKRTAKCKATKKRNHGDENYSNVDKMLETKAKHAAEDPDYYKKKEARTKATKLRKHGDPNWNNREKAGDTHESHFGVRYRWQDKELKKKDQETFRNNHEGLTSSFQLPGVHDKCVERWQEKYGTNSPVESKEVRDKIEQSFIENYGVDHPWKSREIREKIEQTNLDTYGTTYGPGTFAKYQFDGEWFDSSWELAYWIWCKDNGKNIKHNPCCFEYEVVGVDGEIKKRKYWPDFEVDGKLVEIKGNQFFTKDGKSMKCPYRRKEWSDEFYDFMNRVYAAKYKCMVEHDVMIMRHHDIMIHVDYVNKKYGSRYLKSYLKKVNRPYRRGVGLRKWKNEIQ